MRDFSGNDGKIIEYCNACHPRVLMWRVWWVTACAAGHNALAEPVLAQVCKQEDSTCTAMAVELPKAVMKTKWHLLTRVPAAFSDWAHSEQAVTSQLLNNNVALPLLKHVLPACWAFQTIVLQFKRRVVELVSLANTGFSCAKTSIRF